MIVSAAAAAACLMGQTARAASTEYWKVASGNWNVAGNWSNALDLSTAGAVPVAGDTADIWNSDSTNRTITLTANVAGALAALNISNVGTGTSTFVQGNFNFAAANQIVGGSGNGTGAHGAYTQSGGTNTFANFLSLGDVPFSTGSYTMSGGTLTGGSVYVGRRGAGTLTQTAGTSTINGGLEVADSTDGSSGSVTVGPNATMKVTGSTVLGGSSPGTAYGPGSLTVQGNVTLGTLVIHQTGTLNLSAGATLTVDNFVRRPPNSHFNWTGGTLNLLNVSITHATDSTNFGPFTGDAAIDQNVALNVAGAFDIGVPSGATGSLAQSAGTITVGTPTVAGAFNLGSATQSGGTYTLTNSGSLKVYGDVNLNGGTVTVNGGSMTATGNFNTSGSAFLNVYSGSLSVGNAITASQTLNMSGGSLTATKGLTLSSNGMNQTGGTATIGTLFQLPGGTLIVDGSGTALTVNANWTEGNGSATTFVNVRNGGTLTTNGVFTQSLFATANVAGTFKATSLQLSGTLNQTGGALTATGGSSTLSGASYNLSAGSGSLAAVNLSGGGSIAVSGTGQLTTSGAVNVGTSTSFAKIEVSGGSMTVNNTLVSNYVSAAINLSAGSLTATHLYATGTVTQTGGTLTLGQSRIDSGTFSLSAGTATVGTPASNAELDLPGGGRIDVSGTGTLKVNGGLYVGGNSTSVGGSSTLNVTGGSATVTGALTVYNGPATLSGGLLNVGTLTVGSNYTQTGGTFTANSLNVGAAGTIAFNAGSATVSGGTVNLQAGGTLSGAATISSTATINGNLRPGTDAALGILNLNGVDTFGPTATTRVRVGPFATADHVNTGSATLGGGLQLGTLNGFSPALGSTYVVMTGAPLQGHFATVTGSQLASGQFLAVTYTPDIVKITVAIGGDADLDGTVGFSDLLALARHYGLATDQTWSTGDFSGDGGVAFNDLLTLARSYGQSGAASEQAAIESLPSAFASDWTLAQTLAPEPTSAVVLAGVVMPMLGRRRRA